MRSLLSRVLISLVLLIPVLPEAAAIDSQHQLNTVEDALAESKAKAEDAKVAEDPKPKLEEAAKVEETD